MKKILFLLLVPFFIKAQRPAKDAVSEIKDPANSAQTELSQDSKTKAKSDIESYRQRAIKGENFGSLASQYSDDPGSAKDGGKYLGVVRGMMVPEFEAAAFNLKVGEISEVFETRYGYHFLQVMARNGESVDVRHILVIPK